MLFQKWRKSFLDTKVRALQCPPLEVAENRHAASKLVEDLQSRYSALENAIATGAGETAFNFNMSMLSALAVQASIFSSNVSINMNLESLKQATTSSNKVDKINYEREKEMALKLSKRVEKLVETIKTYYSSFPNKGHA
jgi:hypothetical protein